MKRIVTFFLIIAAVVVVMSHAPSVQARPAPKPPILPKPLVNPIPVSA